MKIYNRFGILEWSLFKFTEEFQTDVTSIKWEKLSIDRQKYLHWLWLIIIGVLHVSSGLSLRWDEHGAMLQCALVWYVSCTALSWTEGVEKLNKKNTKMQHKKSM